ncbi:MAG: DNA mismatch repair protein MutS [Clostridiales bacterium]|nr:DNA mismatch repair protein MutS [Candidatus Crickella equi]
MMVQYKEIKSEYSDAILMFRLGDFYEMFFDDALLASRELELTLTGRNCGLEEKAPMCGVPHHAVDSYIARLVKNDHKVAICEQIEDPAEAKGIVKRDIIRVYTPGTLDISESSDANENLYIASVCVSDKLTAMTLADVNTGELISTEFEDNVEFDILANELAIYGPREVVISEVIADKLKDALENVSLAPYIAAVDNSYFKKQSCEQIVQKQFDVTSMISIGLDGREEITASIGALLMYLNDTQKSEPSQFKELVIRNIANTMQLDRSTMRNLELLETLYDKDVHGSLLGVLNKTHTAMGSRLLKSFLREPLKDADEINLRLDAVEELKNNPLVANNITNSLKHVYDFQRLTAKIATKRANGRDLIALKTTLAELPDIRDNLEYLDSQLICEISLDVDDFGKLHDMIEQAIVDEPPFIITEGGMIKPGYSEELDNLKASIADAKTWIANLEASEKERTGIKTLKVGFNKVFGYYIDVSKGMIDKVPDDYVRKQTLVNNERYITPELKEKENMVFSAETKINKLEYEIFKAIREAIEPYIESLQKASAAIALLDVMISFAKVATDNAYVKPVVNDSDVIDIKKGRHPSVEQIIGSGMFVSNDTFVNESNNSMLIITGPNMSGKSTYMRQTAIIVLMAQIGCFVPAESATIGVVDRVFTRIGASDNLSYGQSTFYIEMSELANILRHATSRSLIILDEIGRGTSTFDGLSIAWATVEYLCKENNHIRTMFATHYHELTALAESYDNIHNLSVAVAEDGNNVVFLHNIVDGAASKSYGIHVAKIAGVPEEIRVNAKIKLRELEDGNLPVGATSEQLSFFADSFVGSSVEENSDRYTELVNRIAGLDVNVMTPIAALNALGEIIDDAKEIKGN